MIRWERHDYRYHRRIDLHTEPVGWAVERNAYRDDDGGGS